MCNRLKLMIFKKSENENNIYESVADQSKVIIPLPSK